VAEARDRGIGADVGDVDALAGADVICTCTTSGDPLFDGDRLVAGVHVNAVGSYQPASRELDTSAMLRARVVVETREAALAEAGELASGRQARSAQPWSPTSGGAVQGATAPTEIRFSSRWGWRSGYDRGTRLGGRGMSSTADARRRGGVVGASTAYHAARRVSGVMLLERADAVATSHEGACAGGFAIGSPVGSTSNCPSPACR
jgi:hypothetical protein